MCLTKQKLQCKSWNATYAYELNWHNNYCSGRFGSIILTIKMRKISHGWCKPGVPLSGLQAFLEQSLAGEETPLDSAGNWTSFVSCFLLIIGSEKFSSVWLQTSISKSKADESRTWSDSSFLFFREHEIPLFCYVYKYYIRNEEKKNLKGFTHVFDFFSIFKIRHQSKNNNK
jgi:hypothetical protein